ncbi:sensor histidine kinase [Nocardia tengchongensis]|uniref:sensor histidine kinase n=1 Tax=Nocardia tengchongensis TaxID=2055889 RepID=UPI00364AD660
MPRPQAGIRTRILAIALIPSVALFAIGLTVAGYLLQQGANVRTWSSVLADANQQTSDMINAIQQERLLSLIRLTTTRPDPVALGHARKRLDTALTQLTSLESALKKTTIDHMDSATNGFDATKAQLPIIRDRIDAGTLPIADAYGVYSGLLEGVALGTQLIGRSAPDSQAAIEFANEVRVLRAVEAMSRSSTLGLVMLRGADLPDTLVTEYRDMVGYYRAELPQLANDLGGERGTSAKELISTSEWQQLSAMEDSVRHGVPDKPGVASTSATNTWQDSIDRVQSRLLALWQAQNTYASQVANDVAAQTSRSSLFADAGVLTLTMIALLSSLWLANRLTRRLQRLRAETLALAEEKLPDTIRRLSQGLPGGTDEEAGSLDFGRDEIGEVAAAFNHAYTAAVSAAVTEARTRDGVRAVFMNIAHRSQLITHRQLEILDEAEGRQEDPTLLDIFFKLDHLATRERRNAENLVVLAGGRPSRQWRRPVPLLDLVRSAVGESLDYTRVRTTRMPTVSITGHAVADLIHLVAELVDNATHFSPPPSPVEVTGGFVGKGAVVELNDQGGGMTATDLQQANEMLRNPPDFGVAASTPELRIGLFVVAKLSARHDISVRLTESDHGGIRAIVLIPNALIAAPTPGLPPSNDFEPPQPVGSTEQSRALLPGHHERKSASHRLQASTEKSTGTAQ